jgi:RNA polymerase sigma-70 factor, ECF subfamily
MVDKSATMTSEPIDACSEESEIIRAAKEDSRAFGKLYLLYVEKVFRYLYGRLGNVNEAEDVTSQTFLAAFESFGRFRQDGHFASWLFTIARNKTVDLIRQRSSKISVSQTENISFEADPLIKVIKSDQAALLSQLIRALPEDDKELLRLRFLADMSFPEIAHFLHRKEETAKKSIYRLLARLKSQVEVSNE